MDYFTLVGLGAVLYFLIYGVVLCITDCDLRLAFAEKFGKRLSRLQGKVVWITGASSGIGEAMAYQVARNRGRLVLSARRVPELRRVKEKCLACNPGLRDEDILVLKMDVTKTETHQSCFTQVIQHFGALDILINNAGRLQRAVWENTEMQVDHQIFEVNVFGAVSLTRLALKYFNCRGKGRLVVTSSLTGIIDVPYLGSYSATKHAIHGYYECLRIEKLDSNISITLLCPGPTFSNSLPESFTEKANKKLGDSAAASNARMSTERCARLCLIAVVNKLDEAWMALFPLLPLVYAIKYYPNLSKHLLKYLRPKQLQKIMQQRAGRPNSEEFSSWTSYKDS